MQAMLKARDLFNQTETRGAPNRGRQLVANAAKRSRGSSPAPPTATNMPGTPSCRSSADSCGRSLGRTVSADADAADVAQLTWLRLVEHLADLKDPGRVGAWLATTARRESLRVLRHTQRNVLSADDRVFDGELPEPTLDSDLLVAERDQTLWRSFTRLPPRDRMLLRLLTSSQTLSYEEIAAALDMPIGSIGPTRIRALQRLRRQLQRDGDLAALID